MNTKGVSAGGPPFKSAAIARRYAECSPSSLVGEWRTPTLVIHGGKDFRLGEAEGLSTFTALQRQGVPSELLYFPTENHWVLSPPNSIICASPPRLRGRRRLYFARTYHPTTGICASQRRQQQAGSPRFAVPVSSCYLPP